MVEDNNICPLCGGLVNIGEDNRCVECGEVIDEAVAIEDDEPSACEQYREELDNEL